MEKVSKTYRLIEMYDAMMASLENAKEVKSQQEELVDIVENSDRAEHFEEFIDEINEQINNLTEQINILEKRAEYLRLINKELDKNDKSVELIDLLINALGLFEND